MFEKGGKCEHVDNGEAGWPRRGQNRRDARDSNAVCEALQKAVGRGGIFDMVDARSDRASVAWRDCRQATEGTIAPASVRVLPAHDALKFGELEVRRNSGRETLGETGELTLAALHIGRTRGDLRPVGLDAALVFSGGESHNVTLQLCQLGLMR